MYSKYILEKDDYESGFQMQYYKLGKKKLFM